MGYDLFGSVENSTMSLWLDVTRFLPELLMALLVLIIGWIIGGILGGVVHKLFKKVHLDDALIRLELMFCQKEPDTNLNQHILPELLLSGSLLSLLQ